MSFSEDIKKFNGIYRLPVSDVPTLDIGTDVIERLQNFKKIMLEEIDEVDEIISLFQTREAAQASSLTKERVADLPTRLTILTALADWLGDIQVYAASEMAKFGLPLVPVLETIMQSNFSKLGADGEPIYDERGKVQKGPNYWKPEPMIQALLKDMLTSSMAGELGIVGPQEANDTAFALKPGVLSPVDRNGGLKREELDIYVAPRGATRSFAALDELSLWPDGINPNRVKDIPDEV